MLIISRFQEKILLDSYTVCLCLCSLIFYSNTFLIKMMCPLLLHTGAICIIEKKSSDRTIINLDRVIKVTKKGSQHLLPTKMKIKSDIWRANCFPKGSLQHNLKIDTRTLTCYVSKSHQWTFKAVNHLIVNPVQRLL